MQSLEHLRWDYDEMASLVLERLLDIERSRDDARAVVREQDLYSILYKNRSSDETLSKFWTTIETVPSWVDWKEVERGQQVFHRYAIANIVGLALQGFIGENAAAFGPTEVLSKTGGLSRKNILQRLTATFRWLLEVTDSSKSLHPGERGFEATIRVRLLHANVRRSIRNIAAAHPAYFDENVFGVPINSYDGVLTMTFFCCNPMWIQLPKFGIRLSQQEMRDYVALHRYLSFLLGVPNEYFSSVERAYGTMQYMIAKRGTTSSSSRDIAHSFVDTFADSKRSVSRSMLCAGCRMMNTQQLCDELELDQAPLVSYMAFGCFRGLVWMLAAIQRANLGVDQACIAVSVAFRTYFPC